MTGIELRLPDDVMENLPKDKQELLGYLSKHFDEVIRQYEQRFVRRVTGVLGQPLSSYEKSMLKDFLMDVTLGELREQLEGGNPMKAVATK